MSNFEGDLNEFFKEFAESAVWTPYLGTATPLKCIPRGPSVTPTLITGQMSLQDTSALCKTSDIAPAKEGDAFAVGGVTYYILTNDPDGTGMSRVQLSKDKPHGRQ